MEKVHSAVIGWLLSDKCEAFGKGDSGRRIRSKLLQRIFGISESFKVFDTIDSILEWKNIDILVVTNRGKIDEKCWVIENKIKSSQHSDQLNRYAKIMDCVWMMSSKQYSIYFNEKDSKKVGKLKANPFHDKEKAYCFLSLIEEKPITSDNITWTCTHYSQLSQYLGRSLENLEKSVYANKDYTIVAEYLDCITKLGSTITHFLGKHENYSNVFTDGWMQKEEKPKNYTGEQKYISENGLETIFQKCFLSFIIPKTKFNQFKDISVSETHGTALVNFPYETDGNTKYGFQFQNGTFKIQIVKEYNGTVKEIEKNVKAFLQSWDSLFNSDAFKDWGKNKSKQNKKAYLSITRKRPKNSKKNPQRPWYNYSLDEIQKNWDDAFDVYMRMMDDVVIPKSRGV